MHAFDRMNQVNPAAQGPPAIARRFEKTKSRQPGCPINWWCIAGHTPSSQFEPHQREPILDPGEVNETAMPGVRRHASA